MLVERADKPLFRAQYDYDGRILFCIAIRGRGFARGVIVDQQQRVANRRADYPSAGPNAIQTAARFTRAGCSDTTHCTDHGFKPVYAIHARLYFAEFVAHVEVASGLVSCLTSAAGAALICTARSRTAATRPVSAASSSVPVATSAALAAGPPCASKCPARRVRTVAIQLTGSASNTPST